SVPRDETRDACFLAWNDPGSRSPYGNSSCALRLAKSSACRRPRTCQASYASRPRRGVSQRTGSGRERVALEVGHASREHSCFAKIWFLRCCLGARRLWLQRHFAAAQPAIGTQEFYELRSRKRWFHSLGRRG